MRKSIISTIIICIIWIALGIYVIPFYAFNIDIPYVNNEYKLWLDLQWGIELDYKVDLDQVRQSPDNTKQNEKNIVEWLKSIIDKRVEVLKINDSQITSANYGGDEHIIVQIPLKWGNKEENQKNIERAKTAIGKVVKIEFKELRNGVTEADKKERKDIANNLLAEAKKDTYGFNVTAEKFKDSYENVEIGNANFKAKEFNTDFWTGVINPETLKEGLIWQVITGTKPKGLISNSGSLSLSKEVETGYWILNYKGQGKEKDSYNFDYAFVSWTPSEWKPAQDSKGRILNDQYFVKSSVQYNQAFQPNIELLFNSEGAEIFGELTKRLVGQPIAIFVGGQLLTSPRVNEPILTGKAVITGDYTIDEATKLSQDINTGVVPAPIYLTSEKAIDSRLWLNSLQELAIAWFFGMLAIMIFLIVIYRATGVTASLTLILYLIFVLAFVKTFGIVLTLASIAGLILSLWMAIDANILIFERVKDQLREWVPMNQALKVGFEQSFSAIWDGHITQVLVAIVLYVFGINLIKGFGLMLIIGTVISLFVFYNISRVFVDILWHLWLPNKIFIGLKK